MTVRPAGKSSGLGVFLAKPACVEASLVSVTHVGKAFKVALNYGKLQLEVMKQDPQNVKVVL